MTELEQLFEAELKKRGYWFVDEHPVWESFRAVMEHLNARGEEPNTPTKEK